MENSIGGANFNSRLNQAKELENRSFEIISHLSKNKQKKIKRV